MSRVALRIVTRADPRNAELTARGRALDQELADRRLEAEWRRRVRLNIRRRMEAGIYPRSL